jgi:hypothetical protein
MCLHFGHHGHLICNAAVVVDEAQAADLHGDTENGGDVRLLNRGPINSYNTLW